MNAYGINRPCYPSVGEIVQAENIFTEVHPAARPRNTASPQEVRYIAVLN